LLTGDRTILVSTVDIAAVPDMPWGRIAAALSIEERARAQRFASDADRQAFLAAHCLKRQMLSRADPAVEPPEWHFDQGPHGKPELRGRSDLQFNLSHCRGLVACALRRGGPIGIDVEWLGRPAPLEVAERFFSRSETRWLLKLPKPARHEAFFRIWTLKEAYIKAVGLGLSQKLGDFSVSVQRLDLEFARPDMGDADTWRFHQERMGASHILAAAWQGDAAIRVSQDALF
jgi:4'-phosphopantetheinyl transferase